MQDLELVRRLERALLRVWPDIESMAQNGWVVRFAQGYSGRSNSASAIEQDAMLDELALNAIEQFYLARNVQPRVRISPLSHAAVWPLLQQRGYAIADENHTMIMHLASAATRPAAPVSHQSAPSASWLDGVCRSQTASKRSPEKLLAILSRLQVPATFATFHEDGKPVAFGFSAIDKGCAELGCIMVDEDRRGQGFGRAVVASLMDWARQRGAATAFLQVSQDNAPALHLYKRLGFATLYDYQTIIKT
jgi:N-acetylglutamate synthase